MALLDVLGHETDLGLARAPLVVEPVDRLAAVRGADLVDVLLEVAIGEERRALRGRALRRRARQRARAHGNVGQELRHLERIALLLQELIVERAVERLLRLLLERAAGQQRLIGREAAVEEAAAEVGELLRGARAHAEDAAAEALLQLARHGVVLEQLIADVANLL